MAIKLGDEKKYFFIFKFVLAEISNYKSPSIYANLCATGVSFFLILR